MLIAAEVGNSGVRLAGWPESAGPDEPPIWIRTIRDGEMHDGLEGLAAGRASWFIGSVNRQRLRGLQEWISQRRADDRQRLLQGSDVPVHQAVDHPERTGFDRVIAGWEAWKRWKVPVVVVDAGTAVTVDLVDESGTFRGGSIFPGAAACFRALARDTDQLPDLSPAGGIPESALGKSTAAAILSGVMRQQAGAILRIADDIRREAGLTRSHVVLTGGGIPSLRHCLPVDWIEEPLLVLRGIRRLAREL